MRERGDKRHNSVRERFLLLSILDLIDFVKYLADTIKETMKIVADLHVHSKYARATSPRCDVENLAAWAAIKGVNVLGTGDFVHPAWFKELKEKLETAEAGLYQLKTENSKLKIKNLPFGQNLVSRFAQNKNVRFLLTVEVSVIYSKGGKVRRVHHIICVPSFKEAEAVQKALAQVGTIDSDGRPIFGLSSEKLAELVFGVSEKAMLIPAHAWTPWFAIFGSKSGFNSIEECFEKWTPKIFAIETGLSSDPAMNWMVPSLDNIAIISNSDCHSPEKIMREANVFDCELSYDGIYDTLKTKDPKRFLYTIEFFPEEGKYHYDGHRACDVAVPPERTKELRGICPRCGRPLTVGVLNRVGELAKRPYGQKPLHAIPFKNFIPLNEIIAQIKGTRPQSKIVERQYHALIDALGNELYIIEDAPHAELVKAAGEDLAKAIIDVREGRVKLTPGYDGEYGKIELLGTPQIQKQKTLF